MICLDTLIGTAYDIYALCNRGDNTDLRGPRMGGVDCGKEGTGLEKRDAKGVRVGCRGRGNG